jgi:hypothetical protein
MTQPTSSEPPSPESSADSRDTTNDAPTTASCGGRLWALVVGASIVAGLAAWLGGEASLNRIKPYSHAANSRGLVLNLTGRREIAAADAKNAGVAFTLLGASLGAALGVAGGLVRHSGRAAAKAALFGLIAGAAATAVISLAILPAYNAYKAKHPDEASRDLILPLLVHVSIWSPIGAVGGWAFAVGLGARARLARIALGGLAGAALGATAYELIGAAAFPSAQTTQFVSATRETRLFARLIVTVLAAAGAALAATDVRTRPAPPPS